jgi:putative restriction endonuclease
MLTQQEIVANLHQFGFIIDDTPVHISIIKHPNINEVCYLKKSDHLPLVIHSKHVNQLKQLLTISGVHTGSDKVEYFNSNMKTFDKKINTGQTCIYFGIHFGFDDEHALSAFLNCIFPEAGIARPIDNNSVDIAQNDTEKPALTQVRIGQSKYRQNLLNYWKGCAVTGCQVDELLLASHIKPWKDDIEARLDVYNGLLLSPTLDLAFDKGLISFDHSGNILISSKLAVEDQLKLNISQSQCLRKLESQHQAYLAWHRDHLFQA